MTRYVSSAKASDQEMGECVAKICISDTQCGVDDVPLITELAASQPRLAAPPRRSRLALARVSRVQYDTIESYNRPQIIPTACSMVLNCFGITLTLFYCRIMTLTFRLSSSSFESMHCPQHFGYRMQILR